MYKLVKRKVSTASEINLSPKEIFEQIIPAAVNIVKGMKTFLTILHSSLMQNCSVAVTAEEKCHPMHLVSNLREALIYLQHKQQPVARSSQLREDPIEIDCCQFFARQEIPANSRVADH